LLRAREKTRKEKRGKKEGEDRERERREEKRRRRTRGRRTLIPETRRKERMTEMRKAGRSKTAPVE
jgi:hypothetical protein